MIATLLDKASVQAFLAFAFAGVTCYLAVIGRIDGAAFLGLFGFIVGYYFPKASA